MSYGPTSQQDGDGCFFATAIAAAILVLGLWGMVEFVNWIWRIMGWV